MKFGKEKEGDEVAGMANAAELYHMRGKSGRKGKRHGKRGRRRGKR